MMINCKRSVINQLNIRRSFAKLRGFVLEVWNILLLIKQTFPRDESIFVEDGIAFLIEPVNNSEVSNQFLFLFL